MADSKNLFPPDFLIRPKRSDRKWTALSTGWSALRTDLRWHHSNHIRRWLKLHVATFVKQWEQ